MKMNILLMTLWAATSMAAAAPSESDLEKRAERESKWTKSAVTLDGVNGSVSVLRTDAGGLRLLEIGAEMDTKLKVSGRDGSFRYVRNETGLRKACQSLASVLDLELENGNRFQIEVLVNPLHASALSELGFENKVLETRVDAVLAYADGAKPLVTAARLRQLQSELNALVEGQRTPVQEAGLLKIAWKGIDDLACDLVQGHVVLQVRLTARFEAAELRRKEVISEAQVRTIADRLKQMPVAEQSPMQRLLSRHANLGAVLQQELGGNFAGFMTSKFHKLNGQLISLTDGALIALTPAEALKAARKLDDLSVGNDTNQSVLSARGEWTY